MEENEGIVYEVHFINSPDDEQKAMLLEYWQFIDGRFIHKPTALAKTNNTSIYDFRKFVSEFSYFSFSRFCKNCGVEILEKATSHTNFSDLKRRNKSCESCYEDEQLEFKRQQEKWRKKEKIKQEKRNFNDKLNTRLQQFVYLKLTDYEVNFMLNFIKVSSNKIGRSYYDKHSVTFYKLSKNNLIEIEENLDEEYVTVHYSQKLEEVLTEHLNTLPLQPQESTGTSRSSKKKRTPWSRLSFLLEKNNSYRSPNTPRFSGTITFKEDIVIRKGTKCLYGVWDRDNDKAWLSLTPTSDIIVSENNNLDAEPEHIRDVMERFLNSKQYLDDQF